MVVERGSQKGKEGYSAVEVLQMAVELEREGGAFYEGFLTGLQDPRAVDLFHTLAQDEREHEQIFSEMLASLRTNSSTEMPSDPALLAYFRGLLGERVLPKEKEAALERKRRGDLAGGIRIALTLEKDSVLFFHEMLVYAPEKDQAVIGRILDEERKHLLRVLGLKNQMHV